MTVMTDWVDTMEDYGFDDLDRTTLARLLDDAHKELCLREAWPFLERQVSFSVPASVAELTTNGNYTTNYLLPSGAMRILNATSVLDNAALLSSSHTDYQIGKILGFVNKTDNIVLEPMRTDSQLKDFVYDLDTIGSPTHYYFVGDKLFLWPTPDSAKQLRMRFLTEPLTLVETSSDASILWPMRHDSVVLYAALSKAYYINDDPQGAAMQQVMEARLQTARGDLWMKQYDRPDRVVILDDNDFVF
jgi:hypothetical protein